VNSSPEKTKKENKFKLVQGPNEIHLVVFLKKNEIEFLLGGGKIK
jgi:hypothetical protein